MAGRGPAPKPAAQRVRRNKPAPTKKVAVDSALRGPELPGGFINKDGELEPWHEVTLRWWNNWRRSAQATMFTPTDWDYLLDTALMHHKMWANGRWDFASEVRLRVAKFGATPEDRQRLKIEVDTPPPPARRQSSKVTDISSRRARLTS